MQWEVRPFLIDIVRISSVIQAINCLPHSLQAISVILQALPRMGTPYRPHYHAMQVLWSPWALIRRTLVVKEVMAIDDIVNSRLCSFNRSVGLAYSPGALTCSTNAVWAPSSNIAAKANEPSRP